MSNSVTFDSNVWEIIVDEDKRSSSNPIYKKSYDLIVSKEIEPYFFEGLATMETVKKTDRKDHIGNYSSGFSMSVDGDKITNIEGSGAPEVSEYLKNQSQKHWSLALNLLVCQG